MEKHTVFLVDDSEDIREYLSGELEEKFEVQSFEDGKSVLQSLDKEAKPDLFILDFRMPEMNGIELTERIVDREMDCPIVLLTGAADKKNGSFGHGVKYLCGVRKALPYKSDHRHSEQGHR